jgi:hypothetical protein
MASPLSKSWNDCESPEGRNTTQLESVLWGAPALSEALSSYRQHLQDWLVAWDA